MTETERWSKTDKQIEVLQDARTYGKTCAVCDREFDDTEPVFLEQLPVGAKRAHRHAPVKPRAHTLAPVGRECASPRLLKFAEDHEPERCSYCGRGVFDARERRHGRRVICSRRCARHETTARQERPLPEVAPRVVPEKVGGQRVIGEKLPRRKRIRRRTVERAESLGARIRRFREARGMSRLELAIDCTDLRKLLEVEDIRKYEEEGSTPAIRTLAAIARALRVSTEVLWYGEEEAARIAAERAEAPAV